MYDVYNIERIEDFNKDFFFKHFQDNDKIEILGNQDPEKRVPIIPEHVTRLKEIAFVTMLK